MNERTVKTVKKFLVNIKILRPYLIYKLKGSPKKDVKSKLVFVMSFPRSGTTALASILTQPGTPFNYHGEFFAFNYWGKGIERITFRYPFFSWRYYLNFHKQKKSWKYYRFEETSLNPVKTIDSLMQVPGIHILKVFPNHLYDESLQKVIAKFKPHIVFLRRNHLDRMVSHRKANKSGTWHGVSTDDQTVDIDPADLNEHIEKFTKFYSDFKKFASSQGCQILDINYENMFEPKVTKSVLEFMDWDGSKDIESLNIAPKTLKQDTKHLSQDNYIKKLKDSGISKSITDYDFQKIEMQK
jgi:LPS sulfotransferase NodH